MTRYSYTAYGLQFESTFPVPEFLPAAEKPPDVTLRHAEVPDSLPNPSATGAWWQSVPGQMLLSVEGVARYLILGNREIHVHPFPASLEADVRLFLLGSVLGALLHTRRILVLHASAIQTERGAVIFMGRSGVGKSTLLGAFLKRGHSMLADDKTGVVLGANGIPTVLPGPPFTRLTPHAAQTLTYPVRDEQLQHSLGKYVVPVTQFCTQSIPLSGVYLLCTRTRAEIRVERLSAADQFGTLNSQVYRRRLICERDQHLTNLKTISAICNHARISRVLRPDSSHLADKAGLIDRLRAFIEQDMAK